MKNRIDALKLINKMLSTAFLCLVSVKKGQCVKHVFVSRTGTVSVPSSLFLFEYK